MTNKNGDLYVIPTPLNEDLDDFYTLKQKERVNHIQHFVVENKKPARNSLKKLELNTSLQELKLHENNKNVQLNYEEVLGHSKIRQ